MFPRAHAWRHGRRHGRCFAILCASPRLRHEHHHGHQDHGHGHSHVDIAKLGKEAARITWVGVGANIALTVTKGIAGVLCNSASLIADAGHSASDLVSDGMTLLAVRFARRPPTEAFPYGLGRAETLGALSIAALLVGGSGGIAWHSCQQIARVVTAVPGADAVVDEMVMHPAALGIVVASITVKELLYHATVHVARKQNSQVLLANAWHHRSDAFSSIIALVGVSGALFGYRLLDPIGGVAVSLIIGWMGVDIGWRSVRELMDGDVARSTKLKIAKSIETVVSSAHVTFENVRARRMGPFVSVDLTLVLPPNHTVQTASSLADLVRMELQENTPEVNEVLVQIRAGPLSAADNEHRRESLDQNHVPSKPQIDTHHPLPSSMYLDAALSLSQRPNILGISSISLLVINGQPVLKAEVHVPSTLSAQEVNSLCIAAQQELEKVRDVKSALVVTVTNKRAEDI